MPETSESVILDGQQVEGLTSGDIDTLTTAQISAL
jgi:hypothetical protein